MAILANTRHEMFAQALANGKSATDAYVEAGFRPNRQNASRLTAKDDIRTRVEEIRGRAAIGLNVTQQWLIERAEEARKGAMAAGQHSAAVAAIKEIGVLSGKRIEHQHVSNTIYSISDEPLSEEDWEAEHAETSH